MDIQEAKQAMIDASYEVSRAAKAEREATTLEEFYSAYDRKLAAVKVFNESHWTFKQRGGW